MEVKNSYLLSLDNSIALLRSEAKEKQTKNELFNKKVNLELTHILKSYVKISDSKNREIKVWCSQDRISIRYIVDIKNHNSADIEINMARRHDVMDYGNKKKPNAEKHNVNENDIHQIRLSPFGIDVLKNGGSDIEELFEYSTLCHHIAQSFKENGLFFSKVKEFYNELNSQWEYISGLSDRISSLVYERKKILIDQYIKEFTDNKIISEGNIIVIKNKRTEFHTFTAYQLDSVKTKYFSGVRYSVDIKNAWRHMDKGKDSVERYHLSIQDSATNNNDIKKFINDIAEWKYTGEQIDVYTKEDWKIHKEMIHNETSNILSGTDSKHYNDKSEYYGKIKYGKV